MEWRYDDRNMVTKALYDGEEVLDQVHDDAYRLTNQTFGQDLERVITFGRQDNLRTNDHVKDGSQIIDELNFDYAYAVDKQNFK